MVSTKSRAITYSETLDSMAQYVRDFSEKNSISHETFHKAVDDFCYNYPPEFRTLFMNKAGLGTPRKAEQQFIARLAEFEGECIFLLRDAHDFLQEYRKKTKKGVGLLINRSTLCRTEEDYFLLIRLLYDSLLESKGQQEFFKNYMVKFRELLEQRPYFKTKAREYFQFVRHITASRRIVWVDVGFQFTFSLFGYASVELFSKKNVQQALYLFSVYPWLREFFEGMYFTDENYLVMDLEINAKENYIQNIKKKSAGALLGFAVGDSLGFPIAGIERFEIPPPIGSTITSFVDNKKHPFFSHLDAGQYTDNTKMMTHSATNIIQHKQFDIGSYKGMLVEWATSLMEGRSKERWAGPTALQAARRLKAGYDHKTSGSTTTDSCSCTYRALPLGIFYRNDTNKLKKHSDASAAITHNTIISRTGAVITSLVTANLLHGIEPYKAVQLALHSIEQNQENKLLIDAMRKSIELSKAAGAEKVRKLFGTGSPIHQTLPLAVYCFLKHHSDFEDGVVLAANSYREDSFEERQRLANFSWKEKMQQCKGGNTDGIAALAGAFLGAHLGVDNIPEKFLTIEGKEELIDLGYKLAEAE